MLEKHLWRDFAAITSSVLQHFGGKARTAAPWPVASGFVLAEHMGSRRPRRI